MKYCPYCNNPLVNRKFCQHCNKPIVHNLGTVERNNDKNQLYLHSPSFEKFPEKILDDCIEGPKGLLLLEKASIYYKNRDFNATFKLLEEALRYFIKINDIMNVSITYNEMGIIQEDLGFFDEAIYYFTMALEHVQQVEDIHKLTQIKNNLGNVYYLIKDFKRSFKYYNEALEIADKRDSFSEKVKISNNLVEVLFELKDTDRIAKILATNLKYFKENKDSHGVVITLVKYGKFYYLLGENYYKLAHESFLCALKELKKFKEKISIFRVAQIEWECFFYFGRIHLFWENFYKSEVFLLKSLDSIKTFKIQENLNQGMVLEVLGNLFETKGELFKAIDHYLLSCDTYYKFGDDFKIAEIYLEIARIYLDFVKNHSKAIKYYQNALEMFERKEHFMESAHVLQKLSDIAKIKGENDKALLYHERANIFFKKVQYNENYD